MSIFTSLPYSLGCDYVTSSCQYTVSESVQMQTPLSVSLPFLWRL